MAGGEGSRLRPLTANRPKPLVPICNVPIMEHILTLLRRHHIEDVVATVHYLADEIQGYFGDGSDFGVKLQYSVERTPLGTAGSVKNAEAQLAGETFLIISGDALTDCDLTKAIEFHRAKKSLATLVLYRVAEPLEFGVVITDENHRVERFLEKPSWSEVFSDTVNTGIYILEAAVFAQMEPGLAYDWSGDIFPKMLEQGLPIYGYVMEEYWCDVGSLSQYREAQEDLLSGQVDLPIPGHADGAGVFIERNSQIDPAATIIPPVVIGRNCKIKRGAKIGPNTAIGDSVVVEEDAIIERSVVWDSTYIGPNVEIHSASICSRATIKRDSIVREDAVVGDRCLVDVGCTIRPRVKLWPDKIVERGSTVTMSLIWGNKWRGSLFRELGVAGLSNLEITPDFACRLGSAFGSVLVPGTKVVTSRDSTRSSRMIKRAVISSLLSVGCDVIDLRSMALPVARHYIKASGAGGAINVRKLPGNARVTLVELFDARGAYLPRNLERKVETAFFREDFRRADPDDLGMIENASQAVEDYQNDFFRLIQPRENRKRSKIAVDYGYSSLAAIYPPMLGRLGVESISLNSFNDAKLSPRTPEEIEKHLDNLRSIVGSLGYDMGVLFTDEGERLHVVDDRGQILSGNALFGTLCSLIARTQPGVRIAMSVTAPSRLEDLLVKQGAEVLRTKADTRSLMALALDKDAAFAGDDRGGFIFPEIHPGFDGPFSFAKLLYLLEDSGASLSEVASELPVFHLDYEAVRCPWEAKGSVMRHLSEEQRDDQRVELIDGIKIFDRDSWVLVLPDAVEPVFHIYAESPEAAGSRALVAEYVKKIESLQTVAS